MQSTLSLPGPNEHPVWLRNRRKQLQRLLALPTTPTLPRGVTLEQRKDAEQLIERITFESEPDEQVPAVLLIPRNFALPRPAIICLHSQSADKKRGKSEVAGRDGIAAELCQRGYVVIAPDAPGYEERRENSTEVEAGRLLLQGWSLPAKLAWEVGRMIDYLGTRTEVELGRVGLLGFGIGGLIGGLAAAVEPRLGTTVICGGASTYAAILGHDIPLGPAGWIPGLFNWGDIPEVLSLIAPRPFFLCAAQQDPLFPFSGFQEVVWRVHQLYSRLGEEAKLDSYLLQKTELDPESRARISNWFDRWL